MLNFISVFSQLNSCEQSFICQFFPNFTATLIGVGLGAFVTYKAILWQLDRQSKSDYVSTLKSVFSEIQENERVLRQRDASLLKIGKKQYKLLLSLLNKTVLSGALSSKRLGVFANHKLVSSLVLLERKISLHNLLVTKLMDLISNQKWTSAPKINVFEWLHNNLKGKQKILASDFQKILPILALEIKSQSKRKGFLEYCSENEKIEKFLKKRV